MRSLTTLVFLCASVSAGNAAVFQVWLSAGPMDTATSEYSLEIWGQVLPGPADPAEDISASGLANFAVSITSPGTCGFTQPCSSGRFVTMEFGSAFSDWNFKVAAAPQDLDGDGDRDAVEACMGDPYGIDLGIGTTAPVLIGTQKWKALAGGPVTLTPVVDPASQRWASGGTGTISFDGIQHLSTSFTINSPVPGISLAPNAFRVNTSTPGESDAAVSFTTSKLGGNDPDFGRINFGDGSADANLLNPSLPSTDTHIYALNPLLNSQTYTVTASAGNSCGTGTTSVSVSILRSPCVSLLVNGVPVHDGQTVYAYHKPTLSIAGSAGFIEGWSMASADNPSFALSGSNLSEANWTGDIGNLYGSNGVTFTVSNTGSGLNMSTLRVFFSTLFGDVNEDGALDAKDIDSVYQHFGTSDPLWDLNNDHYVNSCDVDFLVKSILHTDYGDINLDRRIGIADLQIMVDHWYTENVTWSEGELTGDKEWNGRTLVHFTDFQLLLSHWNPMGVGLGQGQVPEPATLSLLTFAGLIVLRRNRRRR